MENKDMGRTTRMLLDALEHQTIHPDEYIIIVGAFVSDTQSLRDNFFRLGGTRKNVRFYSLAEWKYNQLGLASSKVFMDHYAEEQQWQM